MGYSNKRCSMSGLLFFCVTILLFMILFWDDLRLP